MLVQFLAVLALDPGSATWRPGGATWLSTAVDPDAVGSTLVTALGETHSTAVAGATASSGAVEAGYTGLMVGYSDGATATAPGQTSHWELLTGHNFLVVPAPQPVNTQVVYGVVTLGATPPTITDPAELMWTQRLQVALDDSGYLTIWTAPLVDGLADPVTVSLSEVCDSGICFGLSPNA